MKTEDIKVTKSLPGELHLTVGERVYRVTEADDGELDVRTHIKKVHAKGHEVEYWKSVRPGSRSRATLEEFADEHLEAAED